MNERTDDLGFKFTPKVMGLVEFGMGVLMVCMGIYANFPLIEIRILSVIIGVVLIPGILFMGVTVLIDSNANWNYRPRNIFVIAVILMLILVLLDDYLNDPGRGIVIILGGIMIILFSVLTYRKEYTTRTFQKESGAEGEI